MTYHVSISSEATGSSPDPSKRACQVLDEAEWALKLYLLKAADYGDTDKALGVKGQFSDIYRKVGKLKRFLWDDQTPTFETEEEILQDLIGHCLITLAMLRNGER